MVRVEAKWLVMALRNCWLSVTVTMSSVGEEGAGHSRPLWYQEERHSDESLMNNLGGLRYNGDSVSLIYKLGDISGAILGPRFHVTYEKKPISFPEVWAVPLRGQPGRGADKLKY